MTTVSDDVLTLAAPPETKVKASKLSGALKISVVPESAAVGSWESTMVVELTEITLVPLAMPGPTTEKPGSTPELAKLIVLVTVVEVVDPVTFCTAVRVVKVNTCALVMAAESFAEIVMVVAVTLDTEVPDAMDAP